MIFVFFVHSFDLLDISGMDIVNLFLSWYFSLFIMPSLYSFAYYCHIVNISRWKYTRFFVPIKDLR